MDISVSNQQINKLIALMDKKDEAISNLMSSIEESLDCLSSSVSDSIKYKSVVSCEYLLVKLRMLVEFESINVKKILNNTDVIPSVKSIFAKRDVYLSQVSLKITSIQNDIAVLQKVVYLNSNNFVK